MKSEELMTPTPATPTVAAAPPAGMGVNLTETMNGVVINNDLSVVHVTAYA